MQVDIDSATAHAVTAIKWQNYKKSLLDSGCNSAFYRGLNCICIGASCCVKENKSKRERNTKREWERKRKRERERKRKRETQREVATAKQSRFKCSAASGAAGRQANAGQSHKLNAFSMCLATDYGAGTGGVGSVDTLFWPGPAFSIYFILFLLIWPSWQRGQVKNTHARGTWGNAHEFMKN